MSDPLVLCAVDLGPSTSRVLHHAVGFARVLGAGLKIIHVGVDESADLRKLVFTECERAAPYEAAIDEDSVILATGSVPEAIEREASTRGASLIVVGSRGRGGIARLLLGSTSDTLLGLARTPVLLVPPTDMDIVSMGDRLALTCGPVLAAIDLDEACLPQLYMASEMARLASQPLHMVTVARAEVSDRAAARELQARAHGLAPVKPTSLIVRRGDVAEEISRCAVSEGAGLVVMGLRERSRGRPGVIAGAVLKTGRAFVLAVPN